MSRNVTRPEQTAAANGAMTDGELGVPSTQMQPLQELPSEDMILLERKLEEMLLTKIPRLLVGGALGTVFGVTVLALATVLGGLEALAAALRLLWVLALVLFVSAMLMLALLRKGTRFEAKLLSPPGSWARAVLRFVFSKKTYENVYAQGIADMREEHAEALAHGRLWKARWIVMVYYFELVLTIATWFGTSVLQKVVGLWKIGL